MMIIRMVRKTRKALRKSRKARSSRRQKQRGGDPKTVMKQIGQFDKSESHPGCFFSANEDNIETENKVLIIGPRYPKQTDADIKAAKYPYEECLFFFDMSFPTVYPNVPPSMRFVNSAFYGDNFRYHPNLYQVFPQPQFNGKVCLSILGTWEGPGWTSDMNIESVLTTVQSLLGPNPIHNEPGFDTREQTDPELLAYNHKATFRSIKFTVDIYKRVFAEAEDKLPTNIQPFVEELKVRAYTAMRFFARKVAQLKSKTPPGTQFVQEIHHEAMRIDYNSLLSEVLAFLPTIPEEYAKNLAAENTSVKSENDARKQEEEARIAARAASIGFGGISPEKSALNAAIKEKKMLIAAMMASGENSRNLNRELKKLEDKRTALNAPAGAAAANGSTSKPANNKPNNKPNNKYNKNVEEYEEEANNIEYEYENDDE